MQVVHLYQELRKVMGDDFMVRDKNSQDARESMLHGAHPYQAPSAADEQARLRALSQDPSALQVRMISTQSCQPSQLSCVLHVQLHACSMHICA